MKKQTNNTFLSSLSHPPLYHRLSKATTILNTEIVIPIHVKKVFTDQLDSLSLKCIYTKIYLIFNHKSAEQ